MKKLLLMITIITLFVSCKKEDQSTVPNAQTTSTDDSLTYCICISAKGYNFTDTPVALHLEYTNDVTGSIETYNFYSSELISHKLPNKLNRIRFLYSGTCDSIRVYKPNSATVHRRIPGGSYGVMTFDETF